MRMTNDEESPPQDVTSAALALACRITGRDLDGTWMEESPMGWVRVISERLEDFAHAVIQAAREDAVIRRLKGSTIAPPIEDETYLRSLHRAAVQEIEELKLTNEQLRREVQSLKTLAFADHPAFQAWRALPKNERSHCLNLQDIHMAAVAALVAISPCEDE